METSKTYTTPTMPVKQTVNGVECTPVNVRERIAKSGRIVYDFEVKRVVIQANGIWNAWARLTNALRMMGAQEDGHNASSTTLGMSAYYTFNGKRIRIADHKPVHYRSMADISVVMFSDVVVINNEIVDCGYDFINYFQNLLK